MKLNLPVLCAIIAVVNSLAAPEADAEAGRGDRHRGDRHRPARRPHWKYRTVTEYRPYPTKHPRDVAEDEALGEYYGDEDSDELQERLVGGVNANILGLDTGIAASLDSPFLGRDAAAAQPTTLLEVRHAKDPKHQDPKPKDPHHPKPKDPHHPKPKDPHHPKPKDPHHPKPKDPHHPKPKDSHHPKPKDPHHPKPKDPHHPKPKDPHHPKPKDPHHPKPKDPKPPKHKY